MLFSRASQLAAAFLLSTSTLVAAQTSSKCNPLKQSCPADPALGTSKTIDFTKGQSSDFTASGSSITYGSNGAEMTVAKSGDSPLLISNWYLMFGKVDIVMQAAPGTGMVSSAVLESDDLDEVDWELLGSQPNQVQTDYFGKGQTGSYDRGGTSAAPGSETSFHTYTIEWTSTQIVWSIDGQTTRVLSPSQANGQYPQTPMRIKLGPWAGGDTSANAPGVVSWAGGAINWSAGPFKMYIKSVSAQDYSTGQSYSYGGTDGTWQQVKSDGGSISGGPSNSAAAASAPSVTSTAGQPVPFAGTHAEPSSSFNTPSVYPWVSQPSTMTSVAAGATSIPGLPAGWTVSSNGKVVPPSSAPSTPPSASSTSSSGYSSPASLAASQAESSAATSYAQGPITAGPAAPSGVAAVSTGFLTTTNASTVAPASLIGNGTASATSSLAAFTGAAAVVERRAPAVVGGLAALLLGAAAL